MEALKSESLSTIENTARISEQTAAASHELTAGIDTQLETFGKMLVTAEELSSLAKDMDASLKKYKLQ